MNQNKNSKTNTVNAAEVKTAAFHKWFCDAPAMREYADNDTIRHYRNEHPGDLFFFGVSRDFPLCRFDSIPKGLLNGQIGLRSEIKITGNPGEFLVFQLIVWSPELTLKSIALHYDFPFAGLTCFNLGGCDRNGKLFNKQVNIDCGLIRPFWIGVKVPDDASGVYQGKIVFQAENWPETEIPLEISVSGAQVKNNGEDDDFRMSRLAWLNSDIAQENTVVPPFLPLRREDRKLFWLGHSVLLADSGLPTNAYSTYHCGNTQTDGPEIPLFSAPLEFQVDGLSYYPENPMKFTLERPDRLEWHSEGQANGVRATLHGSLEFDGYMDFMLKLCPETDQEISNAGLTLGHASPDYFIGLSHHGGKTPKKIEWAWNPQYWQDGYWTGAFHGGIKLRLSDSRSNTPMGNCYYNFDKLHLPDAWNNAGRGGIRMENGHALCYSGARRLMANHVLEFGFDLQFSPFRTVRPEKHWKERIFHPLMHAHEIGSGDELENIDYEKMRRDGVNMLNIHHGVLHNPIKNYPFSSLSLEALSKFVERSHREGFKVGIYYTVRQLAIIAPEFWPMWSLNGEVFFPGDGREDLPAVNWIAGTPSWTVQNLGGEYLAGWCEVIKDGPAAGYLDIALQLTNHTRFENFYLEGLRYLLEHCKIDSLYLDDVFLSRRGFQRAYRIFYQYRNQEPILDFHAWAPYRLTDATFFGRNSVILREMDKLPYYTRLWLGERFNYEISSYDFYLTEISGLCFGLMGQMLYAANPWRGMLFGMTDRYGWFGDPRSLWRFADEYGIPLARMITEVETSDIKASHPEVHCTLYSGSEFYVVAIASWAEKSVSVEIKIGEKLLPRWKDYYFHVPEIPGFQNAADFRPDEKIPVSPGKGFLLILVPKRLEKTVRLQPE